VGVATVRVWVEERDPAAIRVRVSRCDDIADPVWVRDAFGSARDTADEIDRWLRGFEQRWSTR
jgi:hypothetical protein